MLQRSIDHFAFDIEHNGKLKEIKTSPLAYFMGIMKRVGVYTAPENYESPKDRALRQFIEDKKHQAQRRRSMEEELMTLAKNDWLERLSNTDRKVILENSRAKGDVTPDAVKLSLYFKEHIWPDKKGTYTIEA